MLGPQYGSRILEHEIQASAIPYPWYPREPTLQSQGLSSVVKPTSLLLHPLHSQGQKYAYLEETRKDVTCGDPAPYLKDI